MLFALLSSPQAVRSTLLLYNIIITFSKKKIKLNAKFDCSLRSDNKPRFRPTVDRGGFLLFSKPSIKLDVMFKTLKIDGLVLVRPKAMFSPKSSNS